MTAYCSPQRYLANDRNLVRTAAVLTPSSVLPVADSVSELPVGRSGTGQVLLSGSYSGEEATRIDVQILDNNITVPLISKAVFTGAGSGQDDHTPPAFGLTNIAYVGATPQSYVVQLNNAGLPEITAGIDFEGVRIIARAVGAAGNGIEITVDQTTMTFTPQNFSLLEDLKKGDGGESSGLSGAAFDWDTKVQGVDGVIPANAHRIAFGDDKGGIYLQYKTYVDGDWVYHFVPALKRDIPKGTRISFVTGGRDVTVAQGFTTQTFSGIETVYDFLNTLFTQSTLVSVQGVIAYDRSPTGQAAKELTIRTDAHCEPSTGTGSKAATGFVETFANNNAATELIVATCVAVSSEDNPMARVGAEIWDLAGSVSGALGQIVTGVPFLDPGDKFGLTIPQVLPPNYGVPRGRFSVIHPDSIDDNSTYTDGRDTAQRPPICPVALTLGSEAVDQTITMVWTRRPSGTCLCGDMPIPTLDPHCLGTFSKEGGDGVSYSDDAVLRLKDLYDWADTLATAVTQYGLGKELSPFPNAEPTYILGSSSGPISGSINPGVGSNVTLTIGSPQTADLDGFLLSDPATIPVGYADVALPADFQTCINFYETGISEIDQVTDTTRKADGFTAWDAALQVFKDDLDVSSLGALGDRLASIATQKYEILVRKAMAYAGIPQLGKADASILTSGDGCWRDLGTDFWTVTGSAKGKYAPAFNGAPYYSSILATDGHTYFSTKEFGFQINIKCPTLLKYGDTIELLIGESGVGGTYQNGDELVLPIIAAQPQTLAGGQDGNDDLIWYVSGSVDGPLPLFTYSPNSSPPGDYDQSGLSFTYTPGGIPNQAGDKFTFTVEGGHWRYRRDGGPWQTPVPDDIDTASVAFVDGLSIQFLTGNAPSFVPSDVYSFDIAQPWAVSNLQTPNRYQWKWNEAGPSLVVDLGSSKPITMAAIARHTIPTGATITLDGGIVAGVYLWTKTLIWNADAIVSEFPVEQAQYLRLTLTAATGGGIGWFSAEVPLTTELQAFISLRRNYKMAAASGSGLSQGSNYLGRARSGSIKWTEASLSDAEVDGIAALIDWCKTHSDEAFVIVPNIERPEEAFAALLDIDDVDFPEASDYNRDPAFERRYSIELPFAGVWRR